ncbi:MAG: type II secretion system F family protein [Rhodospirillales bacterium]|nr:type II secretion system F family protein [Rhodospirillales bacterium]
MPLFRYKAVTEPGEILEGDMEAPSRAAVIEQLRAQGYLPLRAEEASAGAGVADLLRRDLVRKRALSHRDMTIVIRETATLLRAGLPVDQSLDVLVRFAEKPQVREILKRVVDKVRGGTSLADAMAAQGDTFDRFCIGMVRAGEAGGALDLALTRTADFMERSQKARQNFKSALLYPAILLISAVISIAIMVTVVIPNFQQIFADAGYELPLPTRIVLATGTLAQGFWWLPVAILAAIAAAIASRRRTREGRIALDRRLLRLPLLGDLLTKAEIARFGFTLGMLIANGVPLVAALSVAREALDHPAIAAAVGDVEKQVKEGKPFAAPLAETGMFPTLATHLVRIGEESGKLEEMLFRVADIYDGEVQRATQRLLTLLVPVLTVIMAVLIGGIIISILMPMLSISQLAF